MRHALLNRLHDAWGMLAARERRLVLTGGAILALTLLWLLVWLPLHQEVKRLRAAVPEAQAQIAHMRAQAASIQPLRGRAGTAPAPGMLVSVVDQSATGRGLRKQLSRLEADGNGVQIQAEAVSFNSLIAWLSELREGHALVVDNLSLDAHSVAGTVNARLRLRAETP
jgi:general secretion pathway protein M